MRKASILGVNSWEDALGVLKPALHTAASSLRALSCRDKAKWVAALLQSRTRFSHTCFAGRVMSRVRCFATLSPGAHDLRDAVSSITLV